MKYFAPNFNFGEYLNQNLKVEKIEPGNVRKEEKQNPKKRSRKLVDNETYFRKSEQKIAKIEGILKTAKSKGIPVRERQLLRNRKSALQSRIRKKQEVRLLIQNLEKHNENLIWLQNLMVKKLDDDILREFTVQLGSGA